MNKSLFIVVGAGGHARVVADALIATGRSVVGFIDSSVDKHGSTLCGLPVLGGDEVLDRFSCLNTILVNGIGGIGKSLIRKIVQIRLQAEGWQFIGFVHPSAVVSPFAQIDPGVQIMANAVVQPNVIIKEGCIVNTGAIVEHDVIVESWSHIAPGSIVSGGAKLGEACHVGAGAVVIQNIELGPFTLVGAGAAVINNFDGHGVLLGVPAQKFGEN